jgi:hypothetical protein
VILDSPLLQPKLYGSMLLCTVIGAIAIAFGLYCIPDPKEKAKKNEIEQEMTEK